MKDKTVKLRTAKEKKKNLGKVKILQETDMI